MAQAFVSLLNVHHTGKKKQGLTKKTMHLWLRLVHYNKNKDNKKGICKKYASSMQLV